MKALLDCLVPEEEKSESFTVGYREVTMITKTRRLITFDSYKQCASAVKSVNDRFLFTSRFSQHRDNVVAFEMLTGDLKETTKKV